MSAPLRCEYRDASEAQRRRGLKGQRCQRRARWKGGKGAVYACDEHVSRILMAGADLEWERLPDEAPERAAIAAAWSRFKERTR